MFFANSDNGKIGEFGAVFVHKNCGLAALPAHPPPHDEREIASAIATVRRAMSACSRSTMRPSIETTPLPLFSGRSNAVIILRACWTSAGDGENAVLHGSIWLG